MILSYTDLARKPQVRFTSEAVTADEAERWLNRQPKGVQQAIKARLRTLVAQLPETTKLALSRYMASKHEQSPVPLGVDGLGRIRAGYPSGLGQWGALLTGIAQIGTQVGTQLYTAHEQADLQKDLASRMAESNETIARIQNEAAIEAQKILAEAQIETARQAKEGLIATAQSGAPIYKNLAIGGGIAVAAALGIVGYIALRKKGRK